MQHIHINIILCMSEIKQTVMNDKAYSKETRDESVLNQIEMYRSILYLFPHH